MSTEDKDFSWLCNLLVSSGAAVPIVETAFFHKEEVWLWVQTASSGKPYKRLLSDLPNRSASGVLDYFLENRYVGKSIPEAVFVALVKGKRVQINWDRVEDLTGIRTMVSRSAGIQPVFDEKDGPVIYILRLELINQEYIANFLVKRGNWTEEAKSIRVWYKTISIAKVLIKSVETQKRKVVDALELELAVLSSGEIILCNSPVLKVRKGTVSMKTGPRQGSEDSGLDIKVTLGSRCKYRTPPLLRSGEKTYENAETEASLLSPIQVPDLSSNPTSIKPALSSSLISIPSLPKIQRPKADFYNQHFKEILALTYARTKARGKKFDVEEMFKDMNREYLKEDEAPIKRMSTRIRGAPRKSELLLQISELDLNPKPLDTPKVQDNVEKREEGSVEALLSDTVSTRNKVGKRHRPTQSLTSAIEKFQPDSHLDLLLSHPKAASHRRIVSTLPKTYYFTLLKH